MSMSSDDKQRLTEAAPDLLEAARDVLAALEVFQRNGRILWLHDGSPVHESASERLEAVIAKAEGRE